VECFEIPGRWKIQNHLDIVSELGHAGGRYAVSEEVQLGNGEHTLRQVKGQAVGGKDGKNFLQVLPELVCGFAVDTIILKGKKYNLNISRCYLCDLAGPRLGF